MARVKLSEFKAKLLLHSSLQLPYTGISVTTIDDLKKLDASRSYVLKVDEGIKKRMKKGLVILDKNPQELRKFLNDFLQLDYKHFIVEPFVSYDSSNEKYISFSRIKEGLQILYSHKGGIDVETNKKDIKSVVINYFTNENDHIRSIANDLGINLEIIQKLIGTFDDYYFSFLEVNPLVIENEKVFLIDIASEVDSAGAFFVKNAWSKEDFRTTHIGKKTDEEKQIELLSHKSQASFKLDVLNPNGSIFMLLSGGGASIVLADEVYGLGLGKELANYGEYSGNPNLDEVYIYTKNLLSLLLKSKASKKVLLIGGGVANFTDIRVTFNGIIKAIDEVKDILKKQDIKIYVRRGGPMQNEGLSSMKKYLKENNLYGFVGDQKLTLPEIVSKAVSELKL